MSTTPSLREFRIGRCLGRGGFGEVYKAVQVSPSGLKTEVALKVLRDQVEIDEPAVRRLLDEGRMLARLNHPVVVRAYDLTRIEGRIGLVTEFVDGEDLDRSFRAPERMGMRALVAAVGQVAGALDAAWRTPRPEGGPMQVVHRDLKPPNVRIGRHGQVKLLDFGIARFQGEAEGKANSDLVVGSVPYMAPERFVERLSLPAGDVFGLGCCLFEGLMGQRFHLDANLRAVTAMALSPRAYEAHRDERLQTLDAPRALVELLRGCLAFDPQRRPSHADVAGRCEELAESLPGPSLRRYCADHQWEGPPSVEGPLVGRTVTEGSFFAEETTGGTTTGRPKRQHQVLRTVDPHALDSRPIQSLFATRPDASFDPSRDSSEGGPRMALPVGVTLLADEPRIVSTDSIDRRRPPAPPARRGWRAPLAILGCLTVVGAITATTLMMGASVPIAVWLGLEWGR